MPIKKHDWQKYKEDYFNKNTNQNEHSFELGDDSQAFMKAIKQ